MNYLRSMLIAAWVCGSSCSLMAAPITYNVVVDTSSLSGTTGSLDFNFNPGGLITQAASAEILNVGGDGVFVGAPALIGNVIGILPVSVIFDNGSGLNDYFQEFTFGWILSFSVSLFGPALSFPDGLATSGSALAFSLFSDAAGTIPVLTSDLPNGFAFILDVNLDGSTTPTNFSNETVLSPLPGGGTAAEPQSLLLVMSGLALLTLQQGTRGSPRAAGWVISLAGRRPMALV